MKIVINCINNKHLETISLENLDNNLEIFHKFSLMKEPLEAKIFAINETISSHQLSKFKNYVKKINICSLCIYSNNRDTILAGKSLKIDSTFFKEQEVKKSYFYSIQTRKTIFFTMEQLDQETDYLQMGTFVLLATLIQAP